MTYDEALDAMKKIPKSSGDIENNHVQADQILVDFLRSLGYIELVDEYDKIEMWYA